MVDGRVSHPQERDLNCGKQFRGGRRRIVRYCYCLSCCYLCGISVAGIASVARSVTTATVVAYDRGMAAR